MAIVTGTSGPNTLTGDFVWSEEQQQYVYAETADEIFGYGGDDSLYGGALNDILWGGDGNDYMIGDTGDDILNGEADDDNMGGGAGHDVLFGGPGNDTLYGHTDHDAIFGGPGNDHIVGGTGDGAETEGDQLDGGEGDDWIFANAGVNTINGGPGTDIAHVFFMNQTQKVEFVMPTPGATVIPLVGGVPHGEVTGIEHFGNIWGGKGNDRLGGAYTLPTGNAFANLTLNGGDGEDTAVLDFSAETGPLGGYFGSGTLGYGAGTIVSAGSGNMFTVASIEHIEYTGNAQNGLTAGDGNDSLTGLGTNDTFNGGEGHDRIEGAAGDDTLYGGNGDDTLTGGPGHDWIDGQTGTDTAVYPGTFAQYTLSPQADRLRITGPGDEVDQLFAIERLRFADGTVAVRDDFQIDSTAFTFTTATQSRAEGTGGSGTTDFVFTVIRSGAISIPQELPWSVAGIAGSGTTPANAADFAGGTLPAGTLSFAPGQASATITIPVAADAAVEANERFAVTLGAPPPASVVTKGTVQGVILNDDARIAIAGLAYNKPEGTGGTTGFTFTLTRSGATTGTSSVAYAVQGVAGTGTTPASAADFAGGAFPAATVTFAPGETSRTLTIPVAADDLVEGNERFAVTLSAPEGAELGTASAQGIIRNDDTAPPSFAIAALSASKPEGTSPGSTAFTFTVSRSGSTSGSQSVAYAVAGIAGSSTMPASAADFQGATLPAGMITFAPGETSRVLAIPVRADEAGEFNERFAVTLSAPTGGAVLGTATAQGVILNDDTSVGFATANLSKPEGNSGTTSYSFTVSRSGATTGTTTVGWSLAGGGVAGTVPTTAADFAPGAPLAGTITFASGQTARTLTIPVLGDTNPEGGFNESFTLTLANPTQGVAITATTATGTIREDDAITGGPGNDTLFGTVGNDLFVIGQGQDTIWGGNGVDSFRFLPSAAAPANLFTLNDFDPFVAERIDLSRIDAIAGTLANDPFTFIGPMPLTLPGQLHWQRLSPHLVEFQGNLNADPAPELRIVLFSPGTPDSTWFAL